MAKKKTKKDAKSKKNTKKQRRPKKIGLAKFIQTGPNKQKKKKPTDEQPNDSPNKESSNNFKVEINQDTKNLGLIDKCKLQMSSSMLRLIDEDIYMSDATNVPLDEDKFKAYHKAYASVSKNWPTKPIDHIVKFIKKRILTKRAGLRYKFADIGCGEEPLLRKKLPPQIKVQSFDIVSTREDIIQANMESLPIDSESINCAVYSLSLMAKNLGSVLLEAKRVLKLNGHLLIVEVTSRFEGNEKRFIGKLDRIGFKKNSVAQLKPNGYFTFFHFTKNDTDMDYSPSSLNIELKPCVYKSR